MDKNQSLIYEYLVTDKGFYYLCGPSGPVKECEDALVEAFIKAGNMDRKDAENYIINMKLEGR